jgi:hypothetical protein
VRLSIPLPLILWVLFAACSHKESGFIAVGADRDVSGVSAYPTAVDPSRVGRYSPATKSGAGYFYDDVLEYRVWLHPENGAAPVNGGSDYFVAYAQYERAEVFSRTTPGAERPLVLVRQLEWIDEPAPKQFVPRKGDRVTEWQITWLLNAKRSVGSIAEFMQHPRPSRSE